MTFLDLVAGIALLGVAITVRHSLRPAGLALAAGLLWFAGDLAGPLVFASRGPLTHLLLVYPAAAPRITPGRLRTATILAAYAISLVGPLGQSGTVVIAFWALLLVCLWRDRHPRPFADSAGRASRDLASRCAAMLWSVLALAAALRLWFEPSDQVLLAVYDIVVALIGIALIADASYRRWRPALIADIAVDLGELGPRSLRDAVADALGDPQLRLGFTTDGDVLRDEHGNPLHLTSASRRVVSELESGGRRVGAIEHDPAVRLDSSLLSPITALIETAHDNVGLQSAVTDAIAEVEASRLRLLSVADLERNALAHHIDAQISSRLDRAVALIAALEQRGDLAARARASRRLVHDFARGVHPVLLETQGLAAALGDLVASSPVPVELTVTVGRLSAPVETTAYYVVAEALANATKHAHPTTTIVSVRADEDRLSLMITDNGIGGASVSPGGGLSGLSDRLDTADGRLEITSPTTGGTRLQAVMPLVRAHRLVE